jgi:hypothetical protein
MWWW